jgi:phosphatidylinositol alpha-1,6-mannosyltransferase
MKMTKTNCSRIITLASDAHGGFGGISQYNRDVITAMAGLQTVDEVVVLARIVNGKDLELPAKVRYDLKAARDKYSFALRCLYFALRGPRFDMVYCAHINLLPLAALIARIQGAPLVLAIYGVDAWEEPKNRFTRRLLSAVELVISISQITLDRFRAWSGVEVGKCTVVPNAVHAEAFGPGEKNVDFAHRLGVKSAPVIMTFGRMPAEERYKGFDEIIEAMPTLVQRLPGICYVAAGDGTDRKRLETKVQQLGVVDHVLFPGRIDEADKADLYRLADAYVMPSAGEGFGFVILEALACGIPVVASSADGTREAVRGGELGLLVDPSDSVGVANAIVEAVSRPKGVLPGLEYFSFKNFVARLETALGRVVRVTPRL